MASPPSMPQQGPRFRPYASPNHQVSKGRYITSNDPRGYIPVYEYPLNGQWIMMDIDDGYILWTGIWKALGNSKADIVKMIDSQPDLAPVIRRVRGGYLKIQGTWMPYEVALRLSRRVAWPIRDDLVPLFGPTFPSTCLSPDQPGYGQVVSTASGRRRSRRNNQVVAPAPPVPRDSQTSWAIPAAGLSAPSAHYLPQAQPASLPAMMYRDSSSYAHPQPTSPPLHISSSASPIMRERSVRSRYSPYPPSSLPSRKPSVATSDSVSLDIPSISLQDMHHDSRNGKFPGDQIVLPPIQPLAPPRHISTTSYALPPISALEDLRGISTHDSAAVLERLKMDDEYATDPRHEVAQWPRQRSVSTSHQRAPQSYPPSSWPKHGSSGTHRSSLDGPFGGETTRSYRAPHSPELSLSYHSSHDGSSVDGASPVSPKTPRSVDVPSYKSRHVDQMSPGKQRAHPGYDTSRLPSPPDAQKYIRKSAAGVDPRLSACRHSCDDDEAESDSSVRGPHRPW